MGEAFLVRRGGGIDTSDATADAAKILAPFTAYANEQKLTGTIPTKAAATITPGTSNQTIAANQFLSGIQTILGDANLIAANIKSGASIFGVNGSYVIPSMKFARINNSSAGYSTRINVTGLTFRPLVMVVYNSSSCEVIAVYDWETGACVNWFVGAVGGILQNKGADSTSNAYYGGLTQYAYYEYFWNNVFVWGV